MTNTALAIYLAELFRLADQDPYIQYFLRNEILFSLGTFCNYVYEVFPGLPVHQVGAVGFGSN